MTSLLAKRAIKRTAGLASVVLRRAMPAPRDPSACVLVYHRVSAVRVSELRLDDWNVTPDLVARHVAALAEHAEFVFVGELRDRLATWTAGDRPLVCLTFDDGFQNFHDEVLPILERHGAKATVFVVSGYVGSSVPMPFDRWGLRHAPHTPPVAWRALSWASLERCVQSGRVEIGGHSHRHANAAVTASQELVDEAGRCRQVLTQHLGEEHARSYAYPYGSSRLGQVTDEYVAAVKHAGFQFGVTTNLGLATRTSDQYQFPRVEVYRSDGAAVVRAKAGGSLVPFRVTDRLRRSRR